MGNETAIVPIREQDFAEWYQQVIIAADLAENSAVRGCMVIKPYGYAIWENIQRIFDDRIKKKGVQNAYFPLLIPLDFLSKEAEHIDGFAKECAVVTHHRLIKDNKNQLVPDGQLASPYIIRPTSEAIIGHTISTWINSYRDLPLKLNQWCNVMRWEMRPRLFLRSSEFLWQEGHTVFESEDEACQDARNMLDEYYDFITNELCMHAIKGEKTPEERFPGAKNTYTIETIMQDGKALQAGTSHYLGQTFAKAFNIKFLGRDNKESFAYTCSWGISTRLIGGIIMVHSDDNGLVLPPAIAPYQVVIIPIIHNQENNAATSNYCNEIINILEKQGIRVYLDLTDITSSGKVWKWIKKGAPFVFEVGNNEVKKRSVTVLRRDKGKKDKITFSLEELLTMKQLLQDYAESLLAKAKQYSSNKLKEIGSLAELESLYNNGFSGLVMLDKNESEKKEFAALASKYSLTRRCVPFEQNNQVIIGRAY